MPKPSGSFHGLKDFFDEFKTLDLDKKHDDLPVPLLVPQLDNSVVFMKNALKPWGCAHINYTQQGI